MILLVFAANTTYFCCYHHSDLPGSYPAREPAPQRFGYRGEAQQTMAAPMPRKDSPIETAVGGNAHLPATEHPSEYVRSADAPPDEIDAINEKAFAGGRPDALERPYDPGGLSEVNDQPERRVEASPAGYEPRRDGPQHGIEGGPSVPNFDRDRKGSGPADAGAASPPAPGETGPERGTSGFHGQSGNSSKPA
jgi:hypothetical protein